MTGNKMERAVLAGGSKSFIGILQYREMYPAKNSDNGSGWHFRKRKLQLRNLPFHPFTIYHSGCRIAFQKAVFLIRVALCSSL